MKVEFCLKKVCFAEGGNEMGKMRKVLGLFYMCNS